MKYEPGEAARVMRKATYLAAAKDQSNVGDRPASNLDCLRSSSSANMKLAADILKKKTSSATGRLGHPFHASADHDFYKMKEKDKIVAKKSFFLNPHRNDPKIIRTNHRFYVI